MYGTHYIKQYKTENNKIISTNENVNLPKLDFVCTKANGEIISFCNIQFQLRKLNFHFHSLRHTHATILIENGANIKDVQKRLGHSNINITFDTYTHATEKMSKESVEIFEKATLPTS